jgi:hypothetical protein
MAIHDARPFTKAGAMFEVVVIFVVGEARAIPARPTCRSLMPMTTSGISLHKEVLQWFGECTRELGLAPLVPIS